jgi:hypothetical protein
LVDGGMAQSLIHTLAFVGCVIALTFLVLADRGPYEKQKVASLCAIGGLLLIWLALHAPSPEPAATTTAAQSPAQTARPYSQQLGL